MSTAAGAAHGAQGAWEVGSAGDLRARPRPAVTSLCPAGRRRRARLGRSRDRRLYAYRWSCLAPGARGRHQRRPDHQHRCRIGRPAAVGSAVGGHLSRIRRRCHDRRPAGGARGHPARRRQGGAREEGPRPGDRHPRSAPSARRGPADRRPDRSGAGGVRSAGRRPVTVRQRLRQATRLRPGGGPAGGRGVEGGRDASRHGSGHPRSRRPAVGIAGRLRRGHHRDPEGSRPRR